MFELFKADPELVGRFASGIPEETFREKLLYALLFYAYGADMIQDCHTRWTGRSINILIGPVQIKELLREKLF